MSGLYEWIRNITFYSVLLVLVNHLLPAGEQKKYVRFFMGLIFILVVFGPVLKWRGQEWILDQRMFDVRVEEEVEQFKKEQEQMEERLKQDLLYIWESEALMYEGREGRTEEEISP